MGNGSKNLRNRWVDSQLHYMYSVVKLVSIQISFDMTHWEELLQSVSEFIFSKHFGCTPRGVMGVK